MTGVVTPCGSSMASRYAIRVQSPGRHFGKGHLWALGTASFARPLPPKRCGLPRANLLGPGQSDFWPHRHFYGKGARDPCTGKSISLVGPTGCTQARFTV